MVSKEVWFVVSESTTIMATTIANTIVVVITTTVVIIVDIFATGTIIVLIYIDRSRRVSRGRARKSCHANR